MNRFKFALVRPPFLFAQTDGLQILILVDIGFMRWLRLIGVASPTLKANTLTHRPPCNPQANHKKSVFRGLYTFLAYFMAYSHNWGRELSQSTAILKSKKNHHLREITRDAHRIAHFPPKIYGNSELGQNRNKYFSSRKRTMVGAILWLFHMGLLGIELSASLRLFNFKALNNKDTLHTGPTIR